MTSEEGKLIIRNCSCQFMNMNMHNMSKFFLHTYIKHGDQVETMCSIHVYMSNYVVYCNFDMFNSIQLK